MKKRNKRYALLLSVLLLSAAMAGCGSKKEAAPAEDSSAVSETSASQGEADAPAAEAASAEEQVLIEDDAVKVVLTRAGEFVPDETDDGTTKTADPKVEISFEVTNKGDEEIVVDLRNVKAGDKDVRRILLGGDVVAPDSTMTFRYGILAKEEEGSTEPAETLTWDMASEQGITGGIHVLTIEDEIAQAEFSTAE